MEYDLFILVQGFCPLKIRITQFPGGIRLKSLIVGALEQLDALPLLKLRHLYFPFARTVRKKHCLTSHNLCWRLLLPFYINISPQAVYISHFHLPL